MFFISNLPLVIFFFQAEDGIRDYKVTEFRRVLFRSAIPAVLYGIMILFVPKSPRWLVSKGRIDEAAKVLKVVSPETDIHAFVQKVTVSEASGHENIFMKKYRTALLLAFFIAFFNQFSGINALLYYAPRIFEEAGLGGSSALLSSIGIGVVNVVFTLVGMALIDSLGRKQLMYMGSL